MIPIVFDLDGTLLDSAPDIHAAVSRLMAEMELAPLDLETVISFIGNGIGVLTGKVAAARGLPADDVPALTKRLSVYYGADPLSLTRSYPGVMEALDALRSRGHPMAVCTNKPEAPARKVLTAFGFDPYFKTVVGGDTCATRKPDPGPLHAVLAKLGAPTCIYIGDSEVDAATAQAAQMPFVLFTQGYCHVPFATLTTAGQFDDWTTLPTLLRALNTG
jgi:phosphoglycolate phosphatase